MLVHVAAIPSSPVNPSARVLRVCPFSLPPLSPPPPKIGSGLQVSRRVGETHRWVLTDVRRDATSGQSHAPPPPHAGADRFLPSVVFPIATWKTARLACSQLPLLQSASLSLTRSLGPVMVLRGPPCVTGHSFIIGACAEVMGVIGVVVSVGPHPGPHGHARSTCECVPSLGRIAR